MRGQGADAAPALLRVDGAGKIDVISLEGVAVHERRAAERAGCESRERPQQPQPVDHEHRVHAAARCTWPDCRTRSSRRSCGRSAYPFASADRGTSVEIFHGSHGRLETRSPVYTFIPYTANGEPDLIAAYLCTPLVRFPVSSLAPGAKVRGTTIAELGAGNRPIDMVLYKKDGNEYLLMSNTSRGVMKIPTKDFGTQNAITTPIQGTAGIAYETIKSMTGIQQLDLLDADHSIVVAKSATGAINLQTVALP